MSIGSIPRFRINGLIDTGNNVLDNLQTIADASGCFLTYDIETGKWCVVLNQETTPSHTFDDSNIIGGINVSGTGLLESYNGISIQYPHVDLRNQIDYIDLSIPSEERFANERINLLNIDAPLINDPVQAQYVAGIELKQSRLDKIIQFDADYSSLGIKAGDVIGVTNEMYGYDNKLFRVIRVEEQDEAGSLILSITALEYSNDVYDTSGLVRKERNRKTSILPKICCKECNKVDDEAWAEQFTNLVAGNSLTGMFRILTKLVSGAVGGSGGTGGKLAEIEMTPAVYFIAPREVVEGQTFTIQVKSDVYPPGTILPYHIIGVSQDDLSGAPLSGYIQLGVGSSTTLTYTTRQDYSIEGAEMMVFVVMDFHCAIQINDTSRIPPTFTLIGTKG